MSDVKFIGYKYIQDDLGVSRSSVYRMSNEGRFGFPKAIHLGRQSPRWDKAAYDKWKERLVANHTEKLS